MIHDRCVEHHLPKYTLLLILIIIKMSGWNLTQLRPDTIDPLMSSDQQYGLCKFFLPIKKVISFLPK
jgi:hypothetical protein